MEPEGIVPPKNKEEVVSGSGYKILSHPASQLPPELNGLVIARWARSLKYGNDYFKLTDPKSYWGCYPEFIKTVLALPNCIVRFAVLVDDPDVVLGFVVIRNGILNYVHVQRDVRRQGIGSSMVSATEINSISHVTKSGIPFWTAVFPGAVFDPFHF